MGEKSTNIRVNCEKFGYKIMGKRGQRSAWTAGLGLKKGEKGKNIGVNYAIVGLKMIMHRSFIIGVNCKIFGTGKKGTNVGVNCKVYGL